MWHTAFNDGVMDWVAIYFLKANGILPLPFCWYFRHCLRR
jgi:hypothetical protein